MATDSALGASLAAIPFCGPAFECAGQRLTGCHLRQRVVFVDVDDTLVRSVGIKRIPMPAVIARVRALHDQGVALYLWSSGGAEYARASAIEFGIEGCFAGFLPKPDVYIDDPAVHEWRYCQHVLPGNADSA